MWSTVYAYDSTKLKIAPTKMADFFELQTFPGKRGLRKSPKGTLEWALIADGVPTADVYKVLATKDGAERAFKKLTELKPNIQWWEAGAQPPQFLVAGDVVLTTDPRRGTLARLYPWLIAYEGTLWLLFTLLPVVGGTFPEVNPVAAAVQVTISGVGVAVSFLIYLLSLRLMANPADATGRAQLGDLLNLTAALAAAMVVLNVIPLLGLPAPTLGDKLAYGLANAAEAASWLLLRWALLTANPENTAKEVS